jgi:hypothetical protein
MSWPDQLFLISTSVWEALSFEEVEATYRDMQELGLAEPPYQRFTVGVMASSCIRFMGDENDPTSAHALDPNSPFNGMAYHHFDLDASPIMRLELEGNKKWPGIRSVEERIEECLNSETNTEDRIQWYKRQYDKSTQDLYRAFIVLLATRNIEKRTIHNRLAKFGVGKHKAKYTTTLDLGKVVEAAYEGERPEPGHTGKHLRPHLRRGHIRRQHYGPNNEMIKQVFIQPVFVNADPTFIANRTAYNVKKGALK